MDQSSCLFRHPLAMEELLPTSQVDEIHSLHEWISVSLDPQGLSLLAQRSSLSGASFCEWRECPCLSLIISLGRRIAWTQSATKHTHPDDSWQVWNQLHIKGWMRGNGSGASIPSVSFTHELRWVWFSQSLLHMSIIPNSMTSWFSIIQ